MIALPLAIAIDHPATQGHFPRHPIVPGAVLLDAIMQTLAQHFGYSRTRVNVKVAKFLRPISPGEQLMVACDVPSAGAMRFTLHCGDQPAATGTLQFLSDAAPARTQ